MSEKRRRGRPEHPHPEIIEAAINGKEPWEIAKATTLPYTYVRRYLARHAAEIGAAAQVKTPELMGAFHDLAFRAFARTTDPDATMVDLRNAAITMAVSTDKLQLLAGQPTAIVVGLHAHRIDLGAIAARLAHVARQLPALPDVDSPGASPAS